MKPSDAGYEEMMRDVPPVVRSWLEELQATVNAQTALIAYLQLEEQMRGRMTRGQFYESMQKWAGRLDAHAQSHVHAQLSDAVIRSFDDQHDQLSADLSRYVDQLRRQRNDADE